MNSAPPPPEPGLAPGRPASSPSRRRDRARLPAAERRRQILDATTRLIAERGFWGLSMQDVADDCGLTVPGLLHHVGSKDNLLVAVLEHRDQEDHRSLAAELGISPEEAGQGVIRAEVVERVSLPEICAALVRRNAGQPEIVRLFAVLEAESLAPEHPAHDYFKGRQDSTIAQLTALAKDLTPEPEILARQIMALMDGLQIQWLRDPSRIDLVAAWSAAASALFPAPKWP
ncbi:AcrR family transcriptional regulator [Actinoplanes octamycinicus]|uniref:AcrR family transcriptional regulator n=1 Tax=Actinoplanes octamycinicus TaxID=135948 RepID=A0A7W7M7R9_9ACTN|nr:TetR/AcrR family transcriptional regulator [Actinoplanes octamycinicus]MBB4740026.1 AcrR family transcriptional regulator [Actinoplanes octamycinicus]GIE59422.1 TetR family transcriptional regulator [Actinoplanes octamycinicus]